jgi:hypothetical protein
MISMPWVFVSSMSKQTEVGTQPLCQLHWGQGSRMSKLSCQSTGHPVTHGNQTPQAPRCCLGPTRKACMHHTPRSTLMDSLFNGLRVSHRGNTRSS